MIIPVLRDTYLLKRRKTHGEVMAQVLKRLAEADRPLNKYQIGEKPTPLSKPSLYKIIDMMEKTLGLVEVVEVVKARAPGRKSKEYQLTKQGLFHVAYLNPELEDKVKKRLGQHLYEKMREDYRKGAVGNLELYLENIILPRIRSLISSGRGWPNSKWTLTIETDSLGHIKWLWDAKPFGSIDDIPDRKQIDRGPLSQIELKKKEKEREKLFGYRRDKNWRITNSKKRHSMEAHMKTRRQLHLST